MYIALAYLPNTKQYMIICSDTEGTICGYKTLTDAINSWKIDTSNAFSILSTVQLKVSIIKADTLQWIKENLLDDICEVMVARSDLIGRIPGIVITKNAKETFDNGYIVRE